MNIYVGNINRSTSEEKLQNTFSTFGEVTSVKIIKDKYTGAVKGFAFVEMPNDVEANAAINALNGQELDGRTLTVNQARPQENRPARRPFGGSSNGNSNGGGFGGSRDGYRGNSNGGDRDGGSRGGYRSFNGPRGGGSSSRDENSGSGWSY